MSNTSRRNLANSNKMACSASTRHILSNHYVTYLLEVLIIISLYELEAQSPLALERWTSLVSSSGREPTISGWSSRVNLDRRKSSHKYELVWRHPRSRKCVHCSLPTPAVTIRHTHLGCVSVIRSRFDRHVLGSCLRYRHCHEIM